MPLIALGEHMALCKIGISSLEAGSISELASSQLFVTSERFVTY